MQGLWSFLNDVWPVLFALALVGIITYGALMPYIRAEKRRQERMEQDND
ncbi:hypothetical protein [Litorivita sp. NS0012-18]